MTSLSEANKKLLAGQELTNVDLSDLSACYAAMASILEQLNVVGRFTAIAEFLRNGKTGKKAGRNCRIYLTSSKSFRILQANV